MKKLLTSLIIGAAFAAGAAQAHYLWIENGTDGAKLYYGEADVLLKEKSPGKLDNIKAPQAYLQEQGGGKAEAGIKREAGYFAIVAPKKAAALLATEESLEVKDLSKHGLGMAKSNYYARHGQPAASPDAALTLDVQGKNPDQLTLLYRGQPLKGAKVEVIAPNTWVQEHKTNAQGMVEINTPWRGQYVLHVLHVDATTGEFNGKKYESLRNHFTYSFVRKTGAGAGPAAPPKYKED